jgi:hypothetical protein
MTGRGPQLSASTRTAAADRQDHRAADAMSAPGRDLVWFKLATPVLRAGLIPRASLQSLLQTGVQAKLCLLSAPAGSGKTTLLSQWRAAAGGERVAWLSVDEGDNDPTRFWLHVVAALRTVEPSLGTAALEALRGPSVDLDQVVLPSLLGELAAVDPRLVLVLDNYHLVTNAMAITLAVIGPAASVFAIGSLALRQQGSGAFLAFLIAALIMPFIAAARLAGPPSPRICWPRATARHAGGSGMVRT